MVLVFPGLGTSPDLYNHLFRHTNESGKMVPMFPGDVEWSIVQWYTSCIDSDCRPRCPFLSGSVYPDDRITDRIYRCQSSLVCPVRSMAFLYKVLVKLAVKKD